MVTYGGTSTEAKKEEIIPLTTGDYVVNQVERHDPIDQKFAIKPDHLKIQNEKLGTGHFGDVYLGLLLESDGKQVTVAVKKSKLSSDVGLSREQRAERFIQQLNSLRCELQIMSFIGSHPNVLELKGAITNRDDFCVVTEFCEYGSLDRFLREKDKHGKFVREYVVKSNDGYQLTMSEFYWKSQIDQSWQTDFEFRRKEGIVTTSDLMWFGWQIAQGMEFLTKNIVHRDIALRNMLLTEGYIVKVADFGLSRKMVDGVYQPTSQPDMPIGYLAPEVLQDNQFSKESESWAFAILLWEMFMLASRQPYSLELGPGPVDKAIINAYLEAGNRLPMPEIAPYSMATFALFFDPSQTGRTVRESCAIREGRPIFRSMYC